MTLTMFNRQLNLPETTAMSVALMAPTTGMVFVTPLLASAAGYNVPLAFVVSLIGIMIVGFSFGRLGRKYAHAGSAYGLTKDTLGSWTGLLAGLGLLFTYVLLTGALLAGTGAFAQLTISEIFHLNIPWGLLSLLGAGIVLMMAVRNIRPSMRVMLVLEAVSMALVVVVCALIIGHSHLDSSTAVKPFILNSRGLSGIAHALVFGLTSFLGFEGSATMGEESKDPKRMVPVAILVSAFIGGLFFVFVSYSQTVGFGLSNHGVASFASQLTPLNTLAIHFMSTGYAAAINLGAAISFFSCALAAVNGGSRILFSLSRDGFLPTQLGTLHDGTNAPRRAIAIIFPAGLALMGIGWILWTSPVTVIGDLSGLGTFGALVSYGLVVIGSLKSYWATDLAARKYLPITVQLAGFAVLVWVLYGNVYPVPPSPVDTFPYITLAYFVAMMSFCTLYARRSTAVASSGVDLAEAV